MGGRCYSLSGNVEDASKWLEKALELGLDSEKLKEDPDFKVIFGNDGRFASLWAQVRGS